MTKKGDIRHDGKVFFARNKNCIGGEYWMEMDHFLKTCGQDYFERRDAYKKYLIEMSITRDDRKLENKEKQKKRDRESRAKKRKENPEKFREIDRRYRRSKKDDPFFIEKQREIQRRHYYKVNADKIALAKIRKEQIAIEKEAKRVVIEKRKSDIAAKKSAAELARLSRPQKVLLTDEQRKERKRTDKRNYKHRRRAILNNCDVRATPKMIDEAKKRAGDRCYYCGRKGELTLDHFEPLAKGGAHCVSNFVFACFTCNSKKRDLDPFEFMASNIS